MPLIEEMGPQYSVMWGSYEFVCTGNLIDWDVRDRLKEIKAPTLVLGGYYDAVDHKCKFTLINNIADTESVFFGQSSHDVMLEKEADLYLGVIKNFIERAISQT